MNTSPNIRATALSTLIGPNAASIDANVQAAVINVVGIALVGGFGAFGALTAARTAARAARSEGRETRQVTREEGRTSRLEAREARLYVDRRLAYATLMTSSNALRRASDWERRHLLFREYLRAHLDRAREYGELKWALLERYRHDRVSYTEAKSPFIDETMALAEAWAGETAWRP